MQFSDDTEFDSEIPFQAKPLLYNVLSMTHKTQNVCNQPSSREWNRRLHHHHLVNTMDSGSSSSSSNAKSSEAGAVQTANSANPSLQTSSAASSVSSASKTTAAPAVAEAAETAVLNGSRPKQNGVLVHSSSNKQTGDNGSEVWRPKALL